MYIEIPECKRCCCFPRRHGIIIFGYVNLIITILILIIEILICYKGQPTGHTMAMYKGTSFYTQMWFALVLYLADIAFNILLIIGAHKKNERLLQMYYYYGITTALATFVSFIVVRTEFLDFFYHVMEASFAAFGLGVQVYLLLLVRSELLKLKKNSGVSFINHMSEVIVEPVATEGRNPF